MKIKITDEGTTEEDMRRWVAWFGQAYASSWTEHQRLAYGDIVTIVAPIPIPERHRVLDNPDERYPAQGIKGTLYGEVSWGQVDGLDPEEWGDFLSMFITKVCDGYTGLDVYGDVDRLIEQRSYPGLRLEDD
jgi:hypothetical protein